MGRFLEGVFRVACCRIVEYCNELAGVAERSDKARGCKGLESVFLWIPASAQVEPRWWRGCCIIGGYWGEDALSWLVASLSPPRANSLKFGPMFVESLQHLGRPSLCSWVVEFFSLAFKDASALEIACSMRSTACLVLRSQSAKCASRNCWRASCLRLVAAS